MNFRDLILGALLLTILTLGAVNAAENVTTDNLTIIDEKMEIEEAPLNETSLEKNMGIDDAISNSDNFNNTSDEVNITDFRVYTGNSIAIHNLYEGTSVLEVYKIPVDGTLKVWLDGKLVSSKKVIVKDDNEVDIEATSIGITTYGNYHIVAKYIMTSKEIELANFHCSVYSEDAIVRVNNIMELVNKDEPYNELGYVCPPTRYLDGKVTVSINGKQVYSKKFKSSQKIKTLSIKNTDIGKGYTHAHYKVKIVYQTSGKTYSDVKKVEFSPSYYCPSVTSVGENQNIVFKAKQGVDGTLKVYNIIDNEKFGPDETGVIYVKKDKIAEVKFVNGIASFSLNNLTKGTYRYILEVSIGKLKDVYYPCINVKDNSPGYSANITPIQKFEGEKFILKFTSPSAKGHAYVFIDNVYSSSFKVKDGLNKVVISKLKAGKHTVRVEFDYGKHYFSKTFKITVKPTKLTLEKVKIKKSAKKLKLTATLKLNGKKIKGKKLVFKISNKKYSAKTNNKCIAKVTIKKSVLNKLTVGKKVKYLVSYGTKSVARSVKVLR